jgi:hypothetical protein
LQRSEIQLSTFGRALEGRRDEIVGYRLVPPGSGNSPHANVLRAGAAERVAGTAFEVTEAELAAADEYERRDGYVRVIARLVSDADTWVYVDERLRGE